MSTLRRMKRLKVNWIGHIWRRNCLLEGKIDVAGRRGRKRKQLLDDLKGR